MTIEELENKIKNSKAYKRSYFSTTHKLTLNQSNPTYNGESHFGLSSGGGEIMDNTDFEYKKGRVTNLANASI